jgi:hypothetical protein
MHEIAEFRVDEAFASLVFRDDEGRRLGDSVRRVEVDTNDPRFPRIGELQIELRRTKGKPFFYGWDLRRQYASDELARASLLQFIVRPTLQPTGEECGTVYDESTACTWCGAETRVVDPLLLDIGRIPRDLDLAKTIAGEIVVSRRIADAFMAEGVTGVSLRPVLDRASPIQPSGWYYFDADAVDAVVAPPTRVGNGPFDDDPRDANRCPLGHLLGLNLLSEVSIDRSTRGTTDVIASRQFVGVRRGLLRPERLIMISPRVYNLLTSFRANGCRFEVAHLV